jgi:hypothetical protein
MLAMCIKYLDKLGASIAPINFSLELSCDECGCEEFSYSTREQNLLGF